MKHYIIKKYSSKKVLFEGQYKSFQQCLQRAVECGASLEGADLSYKNLNCSNIDTTKLSGAIFHYSNLNHANMSESDLSRCDFTGASLIGTCFAESILNGSNFQNAIFGATEITGSTLDNSLFSTLSALHLPFVEAKSLKNCVFTTIFGKDIYFSRPPLVLSGALSCPVVLTDQDVLLGHKIIPLDRLRTKLAKNFIQLDIDKIAGFS